MLYEGIRNFDSTITRLIKGRLRGVRNRNEECPLIMFKKNRLIIIPALGHYNKGQSSLNG